MSAPESKTIVFDIMSSLVRDYWTGGGWFESTVPSASVTRVVRPVWLPSLAGLKSTVIVSPTLRMVFDQPARANTPGGRPSISHDVLPPLPSSTDRKIHTCGLVH